MISWAFLVSLYISGSYVAGVYATDVSVNDYRSGRDDPRIIAQRVNRIILILLANLIVIPVILCQLGTANSFQEAFLSLGIWPHHDSYVFESLKALALIGLLYVGPLADSLLYYTFVPHTDFLQELKEELLNIWGFRNYVFAPITEEIFYTSMILNCYRFLPDEPVAKMKVIWLTPLFFGLAHLHHAYETYQISRTSLATVILTTLLQVTYTTLFGCLTNCVFLKTGGNLWACILLHAFCNYMGFPEPSQLHIYYTDVRKPPSELAAKLLTLWSRLYFVLLILGIWLFANNFNALLISPHSLM
ncbi:hypothetical protein ZYGR_0AZ01270 [Zygosaccharomyces rouxii]|uniref:intramembrane prenyl-peptidase Rce1 n=1 Tax=Zygosaccharomyces rouxii TaxID=4956 RepID=A0A1Q3AJW9_ZYGRO|nr:hypothetical protein ZYGR_0AZ01270 [Zygosaccharomyces rouxii]